MMILFSLLFCRVLAQTSVNVLDPSGSQLTSFALTGAYNIKIEDSSLSTSAIIHADSAGISADRAEIGQCTIAASNDGQLTLEQDSQLSCAGNPTLTVSGGGAVLTNFGTINMGLSSAITVNCNLTVTGSVDVADKGILQSAMGYKACHEQNIAGSLSIDQFSTLNMLGNLNVEKGGSLAVMGERKTVYVIATVTVDNGGRLELTENTAIVDAIHVHFNECKTVKVTGEVQDCTNPAPAPEDRIPLPKLPQFLSFHSPRDTGDTGIQFEYGIVAVGCQLKIATDAANGYVVPGVNTVADGNQRVVIACNEGTDAIYIRGTLSAAGNADNKALQLGSNSALSVWPNALIYWRGSLVLNNGVSVSVDNGATVAVLNPAFTFGAAQIFNDDRMAVCRDTCTTN